MRVALRDYQELDLWAHSFLQDVPLHDAFAIDLPGGGPGRTVRDVRDALPPAEAIEANPLVAALFKLRSFVGTILRWDDEERFLAQSYIHRLSAADRARSLLAPGTSDGPFRVLHWLPHEAVSELQNATVHAFLCQALRKTDHGYRYYWGVYVKPVTQLTSAYMAIIQPFRHFLVYPIILGSIRKAWVRRYGGVA
jgi:hypothetical protein